MITRAHFRKIGFAAAALVASMLTTTSGSFAADLGTTSSDARVQGAAGVSLTHDRPYDILYAPEALGFAERGGFTIGRSNGERADSLEVELSTLGWLRTSRGGAWGFAMQMEEASGQFTASRVLASRSIRAGMGWSRALGSSARVVWGQSLGILHSLRGTVANTKGYAVLGFAWRPTNRWQIAQSGLAQYGEEPADGDALRWSATTQLQWEHPRWGIASGLRLSSGTAETEFGDDVEVRWGFQLDPSVLPMFRDSLSRVRGSTLQWGLHPDGLSYGVTLQLSGSALSIARGPFEGNDTTVLSFSQRWGVGWGQQERERSAYATREVSSELASAENEVLRGEYDAAHARLTRTLQARPAAFQVGEVDALLAEVAQLQRDRVEADAQYDSERGIVRAGELYARLSSRSPQALELAVRGSVCQLLFSAAANLAQERETVAREQLLEVLRLEPTHTAAITRYLDNFAELTASLECEPLQATLHRSYHKQPPVRLHLRSEYPFPLERIEVSYGVVGFTGADRTTATLDRLDGHDFVELPLPLALDPWELVKVYDSVTAKVEAHITVRAGSAVRTVFAGDTTPLHGPRVLDWRDPLQFAASISTSDPDIQRLMAPIPTELVPSIAVGLPYWPRAATIAFGIFHLIKESQIEYSGELTVKSSMDPGEPVYDRLRTPHDLFVSRRGDCEDLVGLWLSLLQAYGIETRYVVERRDVGHVMLMLDLQLPPSRRARLCAFADHAVERDGRLWLPIEATALRGRFSDAVAAGHVFLTNTQYENTREEYVLSEAQRVYPPPNWPVTGLDSPVGRDRVVSAMAKDFESGRSSMACDLPEPVPPKPRPQSDPAPTLPEDPLSGVAHGEAGPTRAAVSPDLVTTECRALAPAQVEARSSCMSALGLGITLSQNGRVIDAVHHFERSLECSRTRAAALCNLGNVALLVDEAPERALEYYECALDLDPGDDGIKYNQVIALEVLAGRGHAGSREVAERMVSELRERASITEVLRALGVLDVATEDSTTASASPSASDWPSALRALWSGEAAGRQRDVTAREMNESDAVIYWKVVEQERH